MMNALQTLRRSYWVWSAGRTSAVPISALRSGRRARIEGRVERLDADTLSLFTQTPCVVHVEALRIKHHRYGPYGNHYVVWETPPPRCSEHSFWVTDDSGSRALIHPRQAIFKLPMRDVSDHPHVNDNNQELRALLASYGVVATLYIGLGEEVCFLEAVVEQGARLAVVGTPEVKPVRMLGADAGYRDQLVSVPQFAGTPESPLIVMPVEKR